MLALVPVDPDCIKVDADRIGVHDVCLSGMKKPPPVNRQGRVEVGFVVAIEVV